MNLIQRNARYLLLLVLGIVWIVQYMVTGVGNPHVGSSEEAAAYEYVMVFSDKEKSKKLRVELKKRLEAAGMRVEEHLVAKSEQPNSIEQAKIAMQDILAQTLVWNMALKDSSKQGSIVHSICALVESQFKEEVKEVVESTESQTEAAAPADVKVEELPDDSVRVFFHLSMEFQALLEEAEEIRLHKRVLSPFEHQPSLAGGGSPVSGKMQAFEVWRKEEFENIDDEQGFFTSSERQRLLYSRMERLLVSESREDSAFWEAEFGAELYVGERIIPRLLHLNTSSNRAVKDGETLERVFPIHNKAERGEVFTEFCSSKIYQPMHGMKMYFGESVAWYFCWLGFYTRWLMAPSIVGILVTLYAHWYSDGTASSPVSIYYAAFLCIWSTLFLEFWKRASARIAVEWDVIDIERDEVQRPQFTGEITVSPITGEPCRKQNKLVNRMKRYVLSPVVMLAMLTLSGILMLMCFALEDFFRYYYPENFWLPFIPIGLVCVEIVTMNYLYSLVATFLNDYENHSTQSLYDAQLIQKRILFEYVNAYGSLFYIAFIARDMDRLQTQLIGLLVTRQLFQNVTEAIVPWFLEKFRAAKLVGQEASEVEVDMDADQDIYSDWAEMMLQYGYLLQFGAAFPLAAMFCLLNNVIELRSDAFKMFYTQQRPNGRVTSGIGIWYDILEFMSVMAVVVNSGIIVFTSTQLETAVSFFMPVLNTYVAPLIDTGPEGIILNNAWKLGLVVAFEHTILLFKWLLAVTINDVPVKTRRIMKQRQHTERVAARERERLEKEARKAAYLAGKAQ